MDDVFTVMIARQADGQYRVERLYRPKDTKTFDSLPDAIEDVIKRLQFHNEPDYVVEEPSDG